MHSNRTSDTCAFVESQGRKMLQIQIAAYRNRRPMEVRQKPITLPARKAVLKPSVQDTWHMVAVRAFEYTAITIPMYPQRIEVEPPSRKARAERPPESQQ